MTVAVAGYELTEAGETLQLPFPVNEQERLVVPVNPSMALMVIGPPVLLPAFTLGKGVGSVREKSVLVATIRVRF